MLIDCHTHLQFPEFDKDREEVIDRIKKEDVVCVNVGTNQEFSKKAAILAEKHPNFFASVGLHPLDIDKENFDEDFYKNLARHSKVLAVGECGLDAKAQSPKEKQKEIFKKHIKLSKILQKPLIIHCRETYDDLLSALKEEKNDLMPGVIHFFAGNKDTAKKFLEAGFVFSLSGIITYGNQFDEVIKFIPMENMLSETDSPFAAPVPHRGKRNEPVFVKEIVKKIAAVKNVSFEKMSEIIFENTARIFKLPIQNQNKIW